MNFRNLTVALFLVAVAMVAPAANAVDIKIATMVPNQSQWMQDMRAAGKVIESRTDGRVRLKFYGGGTQGTEDKILQKIKIGQLHGGTFAPTDFMKQYGAVNVYGLPFVFSSWDEMRYVREQMDTELEEGFKKLNFVTFGFVGSFSMVLSNEPISTYEDMKGKRVWLPQGDEISYEAMKRLQLSPVALPVTDVLTGLQTGLLDIAAIPPEVAVALQWHTRVRYFTDMPILYAMSFLAINKRILDKLSDQDRAVVDEELRKVYIRINANAEADSQNAVEALEKNGIQRVEPEAGQLEELQGIMTVANREMAEEGVFPLAVFEELERHVSEYRNKQASVSH
jgi:TRAP-type C4-dicarboxylate transport system substrate-binding protein